MASSELSKAFGDLARELRKGRDLSQRAVARTVGTVQTKVSLLELGKLDFSALSFVQSVCEVYDVSTVDVVESALAMAATGTPASERLDRPWALCSSRLAEAAAARGLGPGLLGPASPGAAPADASVADRVVRIVRSRAFGPVQGSDPAGWILPFAPTLVHRAIEEFLLSEAARALPESTCARVAEEAHRFPVAHELAADPEQALPFVERLVEDYPLPELDYMRGVLLHQLGQPPLKVKHAIQTALDRVAGLPLDDLRADFVVCGLLAYLAVAAEAAENPALAAARAEVRLDHALRLLDMASFGLGRIQIGVHRAVAAHERLRRDRETGDGPADAGWDRRWREVLVELEAARASYEELGLTMGAAYALDWTARHHELAGDPRTALALLGEAIATYRDLGQRRWEVSAQVRAAFCRGRLATALLGESEQVPPALEVARGDAGAEALALMETTGATLGALLDEGNVPSYEQPRVEHHLAVATGRAAGLRALRDDAPDRDELAAYRRWKRSALDHYHEDVDADADDRARAQGSFRALERRYPVLRSRTGRPEPGEKP